MRVVKWLSLAVASLVLASVAAPAALSQSDYPNRPIRLIVGFIPGSAADITARVLGQRMGQILGQQFVIEGKPGAGSSLAAEFVAHSAKDGYTLFIASSANITNAAINPNLPFDMIKDFAPIALINTAAVILVVPPSTGVKSVPELIALASRSQGKSSTRPPASARRRICPASSSACAPASSSCTCPIRAARKRPPTFSPAG
jgi:tripartite-type tricarboxylate transporter receptor subunit TctC